MIGFLTWNSLTLIFTIISVALEGSIRKQIILGFPPIFCENKENKEKSFRKDTDRKVHPVSHKA